MSLSLSKKAQAVKPSSTLAITAKAKELRASGIDVVGFGAGEPDFNTPKNVCDAAIEAINTGFTKYTPASGTNELKAAISRKFKEFNGLSYAPNQIVVSNGGKQGLTNVFDALINPGDEVIIPAPYWLSYPEMVKMSDGVPVIVTGTKENGCNAHMRLSVINKVFVHFIGYAINITLNDYFSQSLKLFL